MVYVLIWTEQEDVASASVHWVDAVDGGGLVHIKERTSILFCAMQEEVRENFRMGKTIDITEDNRQHIVGYCDEQ